VCFNGKSCHIFLSNQISVYKRAQHLLRGIPYSGHDNHETSQLSNQILRNNLFFSFFLSKLSRLYIELDTCLLLTSVKRRIPFSKCHLSTNKKMPIFWRLLNIWLWAWRHEKGNVQYIKKDKIIYKKGWIYLALTHKWLMQSNNKFSYDNSICEINLGEEH
jgi:hypothetical protein